jgi:hypothetical protein
MQKYAFTQKLTALTIITVAILNIGLVGYLFKPQPVKAFLGIQDLVTDIGHIIVTIGQAIKDIAYFIYEKAKWLVQKAIAKAKDLWEKKIAARDWLWKITQEAAKAAWANLKQSLINYGMNHLTNLIQYGGREGGPPFIPDWQEFIFGKNGALDQAGGEFANTFYQGLWSGVSAEARKDLEDAGLSTTNLCEVRPNEWTLALETGLGITQGDVPQFDNTVACTFIGAKDGLVNAKKAIANFGVDFRAGGWDTFWQLSLPQNNLAGTYLLTLDRKITDETESPSRWKLFRERRMQSVYI